MKRPAGVVLASLGRSTYREKYASPQRHWALTDSRPSANVTLIILRVVDLAAVLLVKGVCSTPGKAGEKVLV